MGPARARGTARAARIGIDPRLARRAADGISGAVPARRRDEPVSLRLARPCERALHVLARTGAPLPLARIRGALRPARHGDRRAGRRRRGDERSVQGRRVASGAYAGGRRAPAANRATGTTKRAVVARRGRSTLRAIGGSRGTARARDDETVAVGA